MANVGLGLVSLVSKGGLSSLFIWVLRRWLRAEGVQDQAAPLGLVRDNECSSGHFFATEHHVRWRDPRLLPPAVDPVYSAPALLDVLQVLNNSCVAADVEIARSVVSIYIWHHRRRDLRRGNGNLGRLINHRQLWSRFPLAALHQLIRLRRNEQLVVRIH